MSSRRLACSTLAIIVPASLLVRSQPSTAIGHCRGARGRTYRCGSRPISGYGWRRCRRSSSRAGGRQSRRGKGSHHGHHPAGAGGRQVQLQVQQGETWEAVAIARQDARGRAEFAAPASRGRTALTYRVRAMASDGLRAVTSNPVSTARWLDPTWTDEFSGSHLRRGVEPPRPGLREARAAARAPRATRARSRSAGVPYGSASSRTPTRRPACRIRGRDATPAGTPTASTATSARRARSPSGTASRRRG